MLFSYKGKLTRTCTVSFSDYKDYKVYLKKDFKGRCAYCDLDETMITTPFEIDHFIPEKVFKGKRDDLKTDYNNLVYACKKCNNAKRSKFLGNILCHLPQNELFYEPVLNDLNDFFYRDDLGNILSNEPKGLKMIVELKLHRRIHSLAWITEKVKTTINLLEKHLNKENNNEKLVKIKEAILKLKAYHSDLLTNFIANYNCK